MTCEHNQPDYTNLILTIIAAILILFFAREIIAWFFKTNAIESRLAAIERKLDRR